LKEVRGSAMERAEINYLKDLVVACEGNIQKACRISGLSQSRLYALLKQYGIAIAKF
jgi:two-component system, NtrC family, response regulator